MTKDIFKYCKYYKGEEKCPPGDYESFQRLWYLEREYFSTVYNYPAQYFGKEYQHGYEFWETEGVSMCARYKEFIKQFNKTEQGFLAYATIIPSTHCPQSADYIYNYGKK